MGSDLLFRWLGVAGVELRLGDHSLVIDPFFTRPSPWQVLFGRAAPDTSLIHQHLPRCDTVWVTHAHYDHLMDVPEVLRLTGARAYGSPQTCRLLSVCGVPASRIYPISSDQTVSLDSTQMEVLEAEHVWLPGFSAGPLPPDLRVPLRLRDYRMDQCFSFLIHFEGYSLLYWSSIHPTNAPEADVLFVKPFEDRDHYADLLEKVQPKVLVPVHWDDLFRSLGELIRPSFKPPRWGFPPLQRVNLSHFRVMIQALVPGVTVLVPERFLWVELAPLLASPR